MRDALKGVSILEVGVMTPGKYCGYLLVGWGASSLRIEREASDHVSNEDLLLNRGKSSLALNLKDPNDLDRLRQLARDADVLIESYRPGVADRLGIGYEALNIINPKLVYCSLSGFGQTGPRAQQPAYDLTFLADTGLLSLLNGGADVPTQPATYLGDGISGLMAAFAITSALTERARTGMGRHIDLSMQESIFSLLSISHGTWRNGAVLGTDEITASISRPLYNVYRCADNRSIVVTALGERSARTLFRELGQEDLWQSGLSHGPEAKPAATFLTSKFAEADADHWVTQLGDKGIEVAKVKEPIEAFGDPQLKARHMLREEIDPNGNPMRQIGIPATAQGYRETEPAPLPGGDTPEK